MRTAVGYARSLIRAIAGILPPDTGLGQDAREPAWRDRRHVHPCFVFMCVCAARTSASLPLCGTSAGRRTATGVISSMRPRLALGIWASNPFRPVARRVLRAKRGAFAQETAKASGSGGPRARTEPTPRDALEEPRARNTVRQPPRGGQIVTSQPKACEWPRIARHTNRSRTIAIGVGGHRHWSTVCEGRNPPQMLIGKYPIGVCGGFLLRDATSPRSPSHV
jgi:hypothetical protein